MESRRDFLKKAAMTAAGLTIVPPKTIAGLGHKTPGDTMNIIGIGVGGKGHPNLIGVKIESIIGLYDIDWKYTKNCFGEFPDAKRHWDWRKMFDELGDQIDGVIVATPGHTHTTIAAAALTMGKHVYCQKPLTHSACESRLLTKLAAKYKVAIQVGSQGNSGDGVRQLYKWIWDGEIGEVREVYAWTNRPTWPQGLQRPTEKQRYLKMMNWDLFIGPAAMRPFHEIYVPWNWRGWWDFGTGILGDMAYCVLDLVYQSSKLGYPGRVQGRSTQINTESAPQSEVIEFRFPTHNNLPKVASPEVRVCWYDSGILPQRPDLLPDGVDMMCDDLGGCIFAGTKGTLICDCGGFDPRLLPGRIPQVTSYLRHIPNATGCFDGFHEQDWVRACKGSPENRVEGTSSFAYSGPFNKVVLLGVLAIRLQGLNKKLVWDAQNIRFTNISSSGILKIVASDDFRVTNGHPYFDTKYTELNVLETANEYIGHTYREGWNLPEMPV